MMPRRPLKKQQIINAAIEVFGKKTFQSSSISEIAQQANIAEGTIYQYFKNKEDLFFSIPLEKTKEFCRDLDLHLEGITGAYSRMRKFIWFYLHFFQMNPAYSRTLMLEMRVNKRFSRTKAFKAFNLLTDKILEIIEEGLEERVFRIDVSIYLLRQVILGMLEHIVTRWHLKEERYQLTDYSEDVCQLIFHGISIGKT